MEANPAAFEFSASFLRLLADHSSLCLFGTFLFDNEKNRLAADVVSKTSSFWHYAKFLERIRAAKICNPLYQRTTEALVIRTYIGSLPFSSNLYAKPLTRGADAKSTEVRLQELFLKALTAASELDRLKGATSPSNTGTRSPIPEASQELLSALLARSRLAGESFTR